MPLEAQPTAAPEVRQRWERPGTRSPRTSRRIGFAGTYVGRHEVIEPGKPVAGSDPSRAVTGQEGT